MQFQKFPGGMHPTLRRLVDVAPAARHIGWTHLLVWPDRLRFSSHGPGDGTVGWNGIELNEMVGWDGVVGWDGIELIIT